MNNPSLSSYDLLKEQWIIVSRILKIDIKCDMEIEVDTFGKLIVPVNILHFGHENGTLLIPNPIEYYEKYEAQILRNYGLSYCGREDGSRIEKPVDVFVDMLSEFGFRGPIEKKPNWLIEPYISKDESYNPETYENSIWIRVNC